MNFTSDQYNCSVVFVSSAKVSIILTQCLQRFVTYNKKRRTPATTYCTCTWFETDGCKTNCNVRDCNIEFISSVWHVWICRFCEKYFQLGFEAHKTVFWWAGLVTNTTEEDNEWVWQEDEKGEKWRSVWCLRCRLMQAVRCWIAQAPLLSAPHSSPSTVCCLIVRTRRKLIAAGSFIKWTGGAGGAGASTVTVRAASRCQTGRG